MLDATRSELRHTLRRLARSRAFAAAVVLSLAVGVGANVTMLGIIDALLFRPPAHVRDVDRVVDILVRTYPDYVELRDGARSFAAVGAYASRQYTIADDQGVTPVRGLLSSHTLFPLLGVRPTIGRFFGGDEDQPGGPHVVVLGHSLWQRRFGGSPHVVGRTLRVAGDVYTVIGVAPDGFTGAGLAPVDLFFPITSTKFDAPREAFTDRRYSWLRVVARLAPGATLAASQAEAKVIYRQGNPDGDPDRVQAWLGGRPADVRPLVNARRDLAGANTRVSLWLAGVAAAVLLTACANVASLLLARAVRDRRDLAVRAALGASRRRLVASLLAESAFLSLAGGACALLLSRWGGALIRAFLLTDVAAAEPPLDGRVLTITLAVTMLTVLACGVWPALRAVRGELALDLAGGARGGSTPYARARRTLLAGQLALALVLMVGATLFAASLRNARNVDLGMSLDRVLVADADMLGAGYTPAHAREMIPLIVERLTAIPGVRSAAVTGVGVSPGWMNYPYSVPERDSLPAVRALPSPPGFSAVTPDFFATLGTPVMLGRNFVDADRPQRVIVVSERFAQLYWPGENPLGRCVKIGGQKAPCAEVIGVTRTRRGGPLDTDPIPEAFVLLGSAAEPPNLAAMFPGSAIALRVDGDPARVIPASQRALQELLPDIPSLRVRPALSLFDRSVRALRLGATMFTMFGAIALVLAIVGMYGTVAYLVAQRTREIGIRMALGATVRDIALAVFGETARMTLAGLTLGVLLGAVVARAMGALLFGISPLSPGVYAAACLALFGAALAASALPARQAMRVEPMVALRAE